MQNERGKHTADRQRNDAGNIAAAADNAGDGSGTGNAAMGGTAGGANQRVDGTSQIAADIANAGNKRKRGRPPGSGGNRTAAEKTNVTPGKANEENFEILESESVAKPRAKRISKAAQQDAGLIAVMLVSLASSAAQGIFGDDAGMTPTEQEMILAPLTRILSRLDSGVMNTVQTFADPATLLFGLGMWAMRVRAMQQVKAERAAKRAQQSQTQNETAQPNVQPLRNAETQVQEFRPGVNPATIDLMVTP